MKQNIALIGPGRVGTAVTRHLCRAGYPIRAIVSRDRQRAVDACRFVGCADSAAATDYEDAGKAQIILLAVPDDQIRAVAGTFQSLCHGAGRTLIHFSGLHRAEIMRHPESTQALLSIHPLFPFANRRKAYDNIVGCPCALEGDPGSIPLGRELISAFQGSGFLLASDQKALYHTAASMASNYLVTLVACARDLFTTCGIPQDEALPLLMPLLRETLENIFAFSPEQGLTGPISRGDEATVKRHLEELKTSCPDIYPLYLELGRKTLELASRARRLTTEKQRILTEIFADD